MRQLAESLMLAVLTLLSSEVEASHEPERVADERILVDAPSVALAGVRVIDGTGLPPTDGQTIVISGGRISAVGPTGSVVIPEGAKRLELVGRTVLPGLIMLHEHLSYFSGRAVWHTQPISFPSLYLAAGVTTLRTAGTESAAVDLNLQRRIDAGRAIGPRIHPTAPFFNGPKTDFLGDTVLSTPGEASSAVDYWAGVGFTSFKVYTDIEADVLAALIEAAHARGLPVTGHLASVSCEEAATLGIDSIEHSFGSCSEIPSDRRDASDPLVKKLIRHLVAQGTVMVTTPQDFRGRRTDEELEMLHPQARDNYLRIAIDPPEWFPEADPRLLALDRAFVEAGGRLGVGSDPGGFDAGIAGYSNQRALELLAEAGWTPLEIIHLVTSNNAEILGVEHDVGRIAVGLAADLVVVSGDPSEDIGELSKVELVFKAGVGYSPERLRASVRGKVGWH